MLDTLEMTSFFCNDTATTEIYTLSLHDALPISAARGRALTGAAATRYDSSRTGRRYVHLFRDEEEPMRYIVVLQQRSEEHTSELQSRQYLVCRLLLEKKKHIHSVL